MKSQIRKRFSSLIALLAVVLCCATAKAEVKLYIPDFTVSDYQPVTVDIMLDNDIPVMAYSFKITLPSNLEIIPTSVQKTSRFNESQMLTFRNNIFGCVSMSEYTFFGNSGSVGTFQVKAKEGTLGKLTTEEIVLTNINIVAENFNDNVSVAEQITKVTMEDNSNPVSLVLSVTPQTFVINAGGEQELAVALANDADVQGLQMSIALPAGFTFKRNGGNIFEQTSRLSGGATIMPQTQGNVTNVVIADIMNNLSLTQGSGDFMKFTVVAPENFSGDNAEIVINNVQASVNFRTYKANNVTVTIASGETAYQQALAEIASLEDELAEALETIKTDCPDVAALFPGTEISSQIEALKSAVEDAYNDNTLTSDYAEVMAPVATIKEDIKNLIAAAQEAQKANDEEAAKEIARKEAYRNANDLVLSLQMALSEAVDSIQENCPDVKDQYDGLAINKSIQAMQLAIDEAFQDKTILDNYDELVAPAKTIEQEIAKMIEDAEKAQAEASERKEAYKNANNTILALQEALSDAVETIQETCPDVKDLFTGEAIKKSIEALQLSVDMAFENKTILDNYDALMAPAKKIEEDIAQMVEDAKAAQAAKDEEAAQEIARKEAYRNANDLVLGLEEALSDAVDIIAETCPDVKDLFTGETILKNIQDMQFAIDAAFANKTILEKYDELVAPAKTIEQEIAQMVEDAKAAQAAKDEEAAQEIARKEAYRNANDLILALQEALAEAVDSIQENCPDVKDQYDGLKINESIQALQFAVDKAFNDKTILDDYDTLVAPAATIEKEIAQMLEDAEKAQAEASEMKEAFKNANNTILALQEALSDAVETIQETCPDVKDLFTGEAINKSIEALQLSVDMAFENKTILDNYDALMAPAKKIEDEIAQMLEDAKTAQEAQDDEVAQEIARKAAYRNANELILTLQEALAEAVETIEETCPDVKDLFTGEAINESIQALQLDVDMAFENKTILDDYDALMAPVTTIKQDIAQMVVDAKAAQAAKDEEAAQEIARKEAYRNANDLILALQEALAEAVNIIEETCPDVKDLFTGEAINELIQALQLDVDMAFDNKTILDDFDTLMAPVATIEKEIAQMLEDAKAAQAAQDDEAAKEIARKEAYRNANDLILGLQEALAEAVEIIEETCPDVKDYFTGEDVNASIQAMQLAVDKAFDDKTILEKYEDLMAPATGIEEAIAKLVDDAQAAQAAYNENATLETARLNANAELSKLDKALAEALATIETECPDVKHLYTGASIQQQIAVLRNTVNAAYDDKTLAENYDEIMAPAAGIEEAIAKLVADAKAAQKALDDKETARQEANQEAYNEDLQEITDLETELENAKNEITEKYPNYDYQTAYDAIKAAIDAQKEQAEKAYDKVAEEGEYNNTVDAQTIKDMIAAMLAAAEGSGVQMIFGEEITDNDRIFTVDGKRVARLQQGKINIIVKADGTVIKAYVK